MNNVALFMLGLSLLVCGICTPGLSAADFPDRPILYVVGDTPGSFLDTLSRQQQSLLKDILGVPIVITYRPGGEGASSWSFLSQSPADGYVVSSMLLPSLILNPLVRKNVGYDPNSLTPLVIYHQVPIGLAVRSDHPAKNLREFVNGAKKNPRQIKVGVDARYSPQYFALYQLQKQAGIDLTTVIFAGPAKQMTGFLSGHAEAVMARFTDLLAYSKELRILAIGARERLPEFPSIPTFVESGVEIVLSIDFGMCVRKSVPMDRIRVLEKAFLRISQTDAHRNELGGKGFIPLAMGSSQALLRMERMREEFKGLVAEVDKYQGWSVEIGR